jgi:hypothetical protein
MGLRVVANPGEIPWDFRAALASNLTMFNGKMLDIQFANLVGDITSGWWFGT